MPVRGSFEVQSAWLRLSARGHGTVTSEPQDETQEAPQFSLAAVSLALTAAASFEAAQYGAVIAQAEEGAGIPTTGYSAYQAAKIAADAMILYAVGGNLMQACDLAAARLASVTVTLGEARMKLDADAAQATPMLQGWLQDSFTMANAAPVWVAIDRHGADGLPYFGKVEILAFEGDMCGAVSMEINGATVTACYGAPLAEPETFLIRGGKLLTSIPGDQLYSIGRHIAIAEAVPLADRMAALKAALAMPARVTLH